VRDLQVVQEGEHVIDMKTALFVYQKCMSCGWLMIQHVVSNTTRGIILVCPMNDAPGVPDITAMLDAARPQWIRWGHRR